MIKVIELFAGIGSQHSALKRLGIDFEVLGISEIDKYALKSYEAIHGKVKNFGDISKIRKLPYADFWTYSFPCQDLSKAGNLKGLSNKTRSGLLFEVERLLDIAKENNELPKYLLMENVKNLVSDRFINDFNKWLRKLNDLGYNSYFKVLNAKDYGVPQNRERIFCISIIKEIDQGYTFPDPIKLDIKLDDILINNVPEKYFISKEKTINLLDKFINKGQDISYCIDSNYSKGMNVQGYFKRSRRQLVYQKISISQATNSKFVDCLLPGVIDLSYPDSKTRRGRVIDNGKIVPTLLTSSQDLVYVNQELRIRKLLPIETFRLMGFTDTEFYKAESVCSNHQLYKQAGNSIVVNVLVGLFKNLFDPDSTDLQLQFKI